MYSPYDIPPPNPNAWLPPALHDKVPRKLSPALKLRRAAAVHIDDGRWLFDRYRRGRALP